MHGGSLFAATRCCAARIGFYVAVHPWLRAAGVVKVGYSTNLDTRLQMASFKTCFTPEWRYHATFECKRRQDALLLEQAVLYCLQHKRIAARELLRMDACEAAAAAEHIAHHLGLRMTRRRHDDTPHATSAVDGDEGAGHASDGHADATTSTSAAAAASDVATAAGDDATTTPPLARTATREEAVLQPYVNLLDPLRHAFVRAERDLQDPRSTTSSSSNNSTTVASSAVAVDGDDKDDKNGEDKATARVVCDDGDTDEDLCHLLHDIALPTLDNGDGAATYALTSLRPYQREAVQRVWAELQRSGRTICQMACRCGKTPVAYAILTAVLHDTSPLSPTLATTATTHEATRSRDGRRRRGADGDEQQGGSEHLQQQQQQRNDDDGEDGEGGGGGARRVLYLVPGLSLLRQTAQKLYAYGLRDVPMLLIGSDTRPVVLDDAHTATMTTDATAIRECVLGSRRLVVLCTYHSSPLLAQLRVFALTVFDECHRVCGSVRRTAFNTILLQSAESPAPSLSSSSCACATPAAVSGEASGKRLFLTATPTYDTPIRMSDTRYFGGIAYRYYLREGIDAGFVNPFAVRIVLGPAATTTTTTATATDDDDVAWDLTPYLHEAMRMVNKLLVFCRNIAHAEALHAQLTAATRPDDVAPFVVLLAHSRLGGGAVADTLARFVATPRCLLLNVRLFQEGVEVPDLNAVFFAAPRYSPRDIVQSICRPLNRLPHKPPSYVFLPAQLDARYAADDPVNLRHFATLVPFTDALMDEDPALFEYMIDPQNRHYDLRVVGVRTLTLTSEQLHTFVLPAIRRGVRYSARSSDRLVRAARLPWALVYGELRRIVVECHRYPKTNDAWVVGQTSLSMHAFCRYVRKGYALYMAGAPTYLQTYQLRDLEALPMWSTYGLHGPYPWHECLRTLARHLEQHAGRPPILDVHKGGYIGLDATPFERLAGCLMNVNQSDATHGLRLPPDKQRDLDELCARFGLRWRKPRDAAGVLLPPSSAVAAAAGQTTFITQSYERFKRLYALRHAVPRFQRYLDVHFPGYPDKHARMESLHNLRAGHVPPRHQPARTAPARTQQRRHTRAGTAATTAAATPPRPTWQDGQRDARTRDATTRTVAHGNTTRRRGARTRTTTRPTTTTMPTTTTTTNDGGSDSDTVESASACDAPARVPLSHEQRMVVCRVCRLRVRADEWHDHMHSDPHRRRQDELHRPLSHVHRL